MPTGKSQPARRTGTFQPRRHKAAIAVGVLALLAVSLFWAWEPLTMQARAGTAFGARVGCSCHFVGGRAVGDCQKDFVDGMGLVSLSADDEAKTVTASVPLLSSTTATWREGWGCVLEPYEG
ncbi:hypothetical protein [Croceicoccus sp. BE223]|uniref:hypothetical protein n=1 Tax=Croceicoccus sp. BE223 TaxID=2817716 RepID=UPI00285C8B12|nr:hypothetical protein [Croceicoccus sp. BE223]MDR7102226.1 hypothetical protein [Croceicoccus sp. BE223]